MRKSYNLMLNVSSVELLAALADEVDDDVRGWCSSRTERVRRYLRAR